MRHTRAMMRHYGIWSKPFINELCKRVVCAWRWFARDPLRMWKDINDLEVNCHSTPPPILRYSTYSWGVEWKIDNHDYRRRVHYFHVSCSFRVQIGRFAFCYPLDDERAVWKKKSEISLDVSLLLLQTDSCKSCCGHIFFLCHYWSFCSFFPAQAEFYVCGSAAFAQR